MALTSLLLMVKRSAGSNQSALVKSVNAAVTDLQALADGIDRAIETLPWRTSDGSIEVLRLHARRARAIATALAIESRDPDPEMTGILFKAKRAVGRGALAGLTLVGGVGVGAREQAGADAWNAVWSRAEQVIGIEGSGGSKEHGEAKPKAQANRSSSCIDHGPC